MKMIAIVNGIEPGTHITPAANCWSVSALIPPGRRSESGYRIYGENDLHALRFVKRARTLGFSLDQIRDLLSLWQNKERASADVKSIALGHVDELNQRIAELTEMRDTLQTLARCCKGNDRPDCPILQSLADPK